MVTTGLFGANIVREKHLPCSDGRRMDNLAIVWASDPSQAVPKEEGRAMRGRALDYRCEEEKSKGRTLECSTSSFKDGAAEWRGGTEMGASSGLRMGLSRAAAS